MTPKISRNTLALAALQPSDVQNLPRSPQIIFASAPLWQNPSWAPSTPLAHSSVKNYWEFKETQAGALTQALGQLHNDGLECISNCTVSQAQVNQTLFNLRVRKGFHDVNKPYLEKTLTDIVDFYKRNPKISAKEAKKQMASIYEKNKSDWEAAEAKETAFSKWGKRGNDMLFEVGKSIPGAGKILGPAKIATQVGIEELDSQVLAPAKREKGRQYRADVLEQKTQDPYSTDTALTELEQMAAIRGRYAGVEEAFNKYVLADLGLSTRQLGQGLDNSDPAFKMQVETLMSLEKLGGNTYRLNVKIDRLNSQMRDVYKGIRELTQSPWDNFQNKLGIRAQQVSDPKLRQEILDTLEKDPLEAFNKLYPNLSQAEQENYIKDMVSKGWLTDEDAKKLTSNAGLDYDALKKKLSPDVQKSLRKQESEKFYSTLNDVQEGATLAANLIGLVNPKLARKLAAVTNAGIKIASIAFQMSAGITTGNVIAMANAAFELAGALFGSQGPSADEIIIEGIQNIQKQLGEIQRGLIAIDEKLNSIIEMLKETFRMMENYQSTSLATIENALRKIVGLDESLQTTSTDAKSQFADVYSLSFKDCQLNVVSSRTTNINIQNLDKCFSVFNVFAQEASTNSIFSGGNGAFSSPRKDTYFSYEAIRNRFSKLALTGDTSLYEMGFALNDMATFSAQRLGYPLVANGVTLGNPMVWATAVDQMNKLLKKDPRLTKQFFTESRTPEVLRDVAVVGKNILDFSRAISQKPSKTTHDNTTPTLAKAGQDQDGLGFFYKLLDEYRNQLVEYKQSIHTLGNAFLNSLPTRGGTDETHSRGNYLIDDARDKGIDLFKGQSQTTSYEPKLDDKLSINPSLGFDIAPDYRNRLLSAEEKKKFHENIPPAYAMAMALGLGEIKFTWSYAGFEGERVVRKRVYLLRVPAADANNFQYQIVNPPTDRRVQPLSNPRLFDGQVFEPKEGYVYAKYVSDKPEAFTDHIPGQEGWKIVGDFPAEMIQDRDKTGSPIIRLRGYLEINGKLKESLFPNGGGTTELDFFRMEGYRKNYDEVDTFTSVQNDEGGGNGQRMNRVLGEESSSIFNHMLYGHNDVVALKDISPDIQKDINANQKIIEGAVQNRLNQIRQEFLTRLTVLTLAVSDTKELTPIETNYLEKAGNLRAVKNLVQAFVKLGLADSLTKDVDLRSVLFGDKRIWDPTLLGEQIGHVGPALFDGKLDFSSGGNLEQFLADDKNGDWLEQPIHRLSQAIERALLDEDRKEGMPYISQRLNAIGQLFKQFRNVSPASTDSADLTDILGP